MTRTAIALLCCAWVLGCGGASRDAEGTREILENLSKAGFPASDTRVVDGAVYVGGDAAVSLDASREMLETGNTRQEQYRTNNVVSTQIQIIKIRPSSSTPVKIRQGLVEAIANFNDLSFGINFALEPNPCELDPNCPP
ncbi:M57 family metalloprotease, partial [Corallococcus sp. CA041A]